MAEWPRLYDPVRQVLRHRVSLKCHPAPRPTPQQVASLSRFAARLAGGGGRGRRWGGETDDVTFLACIE